MQQDNDEDEHEVEIVEGEVGGEAVDDGLTVHSLVAEAEEQPMEEQD